MRRNGGSRDLAEAWPGDSRRALRRRGRRTRPRTSIASSAPGAASPSSIASDLQDSPAYRLNHEEVIKSLEEGIRFAERLNPVECIPDDLRRRGRTSLRIPGAGEWPLEIVRRVRDAARPRRHDRRGHAPQHHLQSRTSRHVPARRQGRVLSRPRLCTIERAAKQARPAGRGEIGFFTSYEKQGRYVTFFGDNHPQYAGNVVKAMASAKDGHPEIARHLSGRDSAV